MGKSVIKNPRKVHSGPSTDPGIESRLTYLENNEYKITYYEIISGTSGSLTVPSQASINEGEFGASGNAILSEINVDQKPIFQSPQTSGGVIVTANLDANTGNWLASGVYTSSTVALIYSIKIDAKYYQNLNYDNIIETVQIFNGSQDLQSVTDIGNTTTNSIEAQSFITTGGLSSQFVKGDGSLDSTTYISTADELAALVESAPTVAPDAGEYTFATDGAGIGRKHKWFDIFTFLVTASNVGNYIHGLSTKSTPIDSDEIGFVDTADSNKEKKITWLQAWTNYFKVKTDTLYQSLNSNLTSWAAITRASGFDTFVTTPNSANLAALITDEGTAFNKNFGSTSGTVTEGNDSRLSDSRNRKYFAYDNTTNTFTGTTSPTIVRTISIPANSMLSNSTLDLFVNLTKTGTNSIFSMFLYITTNSGAATGGTQIGANGTGATSTLQFGKRFRLTNKNSQTSQLGQTASNNAENFSSPINAAKQSLTIDFTVQQYLHIVVTAASALDTVGVTDYQMYIDHP